MSTTKRVVEFMISAGWNFMTFGSELSSATFKCTHMISHDYLVRNPFMFTSELDLLLTSVLIYNKSLLLASEHRRSCPLNDNTCRYLHKTGFTKQTHNLHPPFSSSFCSLQQLLMSPVWFPASPFVSFLIFPSIPLLFSGSLFLGFQKEVNNVSYQTSLSVLTERDEKETETKPRKRPRRYEERG